MAGTCAVWMAGVVILSLDLAMDITSQQHKGTMYVALAMVAFGASQAILFAASPIIEQVTYRRVNGSMFSSALDLVAVSCVYKFWNTITDDTWGDVVF
ncbi:hypothetical protein BG004_000753 [Podila humilis]|nr:hypothetical protein BG004_000753 [Podila humilis]